ncbi:hypothetical protein FA13DRAFT_1823286 [Coprinellus micaceus]|uniref:DUF6593 domain-containing protein n=1 Tax=Coprinellus micaceus TaxID=71717 RepID=A0A4Y7S0F2_COPMI|nr:hypothetical protein FA13DRAFT_1823286 [Coprinellus micaceus]
MYTGTRHFLPLFLEDRSGQLTGSEFVDVHDRVKLSYRRTRQDQRGTQYCIYETSSNRDDAMTRPVIALDFGVKGELGSITFTFGKTGRSTRIEEYLRKSNGSPRCRTFTAQDGRPYRWSYRTHEDHEWTCVDASSKTVAFYHLKTPGEPQYALSSGCTLTVEEHFSDMASEFLATCMIMRHVAAYNLQ